MPATTPTSLTTTCPPIGTRIGTVPAGQVLAGWAMVATGDGRYVVTKSGACYGQEHDGTIACDLAWDAVDAYLRGRS